MQLINFFFRSHISEDFLDRNIACSHLRAWYFFVESIRSQKEECKFSAWSCPQGRMSYIKGMCFPMEIRERNQEMGYAANRESLGIYYLATRTESPFCGIEIQWEYNLINLKNTKNNYYTEMSQNSTYESSWIWRVEMNTKVLYYFVICEIKSNDRDIYFKNRINSGGKKCTTNYVILLVIHVFLQRNKKYYKILGKTTKLVNVIKRNFSLKNPTTFENIQWISTTKT